MSALSNIDRISTLIRAGAVFFVGHSGGKDSQAMYAALSRLIPRNQLRVVHAHLGEVEWPGVIEHIERNIDHDLIIAKARNASGEEVGLFDMVRHRRKALLAKGQPNAPAWPSSSQRYCTSDLKTGPIWREIRNAGAHRIVVNCCGIRAQESTARAKKIAQRGTLNLNAKNTNGKRDAYDWWPIAHWTEYEVWNEIVQVAKQWPHQAYNLQCSVNAANEISGYVVRGNERLSCMFCIFGSRNDLAHARRANSALYQQYVELEREVGSTMFNGESIEERAA